MYWESVNVAAEGLTSFLLFHQFRRLIKVTSLCRKHDISCTQSATLAFIAVSLSILFLIYSISGFQSLLKDKNLVTKLPSTEENYGIRAVNVEKVLDGDTIKLAGGETVVYKGIDAPESFRGQSWLSEYSRAATQLNRKLVEGKQVILELDPFRRDKYERIPAYVYSGDVFVNGELVRQGLAMAANYSTEEGISPLLSRLQLEAKLRAAGIWKHATPPPDTQNKPVIGNKRTRIYHLPAGRYYELVSPGNRVYFPNEEAARLANYRKAQY